MIKTCRICHWGKRLSGKSVCYKCFLDKERAKRELKLAKLKERKKRKVEKDHNSYRYLHKIAWNLMSLKVRNKGAVDGFNLCYTCCKRLPVKELSAGHFHHSKLDFDERNLKPQCAGCNTYRHGNLAIYGTKLAQELGIEGMKQLDADAHQIQYTRQDLLEIIRKLS